MPLFLFKNFEEKENLRISDAPVSLQDIPKTILNELNLKNDTFKGRAITEVSEKDVRTRYFYSYSWDDSWEKEYMPEMKKYEIKGHSWNGNDYKEIGELYTSDGIKKYEVFHKYKPDEGITFNKNGNYEKYVLSGYSSPEQSHTWTDGEYATIRLSIEPTGSDFIMNLDTGVYVVSKKHESQYLQIYINDELVKELNLPSEQEKLKNILIPQRIIGDGNLVIAFKMIDNISPLELGESNDGRKLGLAVNKITIKNKVE
jgi:hypothetical protein